MRFGVRLDFGVPVDVERGRASPPSRIPVQHRRRCASPLRRLAIGLERGALLRPTLGRGLRGRRVRGVRAKGGFACAADGAAEARRRGGELSGRSLDCRERVAEALCEDRRVPGARLGASVEFLQGSRLRLSPRNRLAHLTAPGRARSSRVAARSRRPRRVGRAVERPPHRGRARCRRPSPHRSASRC